MYISQNVELSSLFKWILHALHTKTLRDTTKKLVFGASPLSVSEIPGVDFTTVPHFDTGSQYSVWYSLQFMLKANMAPVEAPRYF